MQLEQNLPWIAMVLAFILGLFWMRQLGFFRGLLAFICRCLWLTPIFLGFFPLDVSEKLPQSMNVKPIHILFDDSASMTTPAVKNNSQLHDLVAELRRNCQELECNLKEYYLSEIAPKTREGYSPIREALQSWFYKISPEPWVLITDGGDSHLSSPWPEGLNGSGLSSDPHVPRGTIVGYQHKEMANFWIKEVQLPPLSFENMPLMAEVSLARSSEQKHAQNLQVQVEAADRVLTSVNIDFAEGEQEALQSIAIPPLGRGQHLISFRILPSAHEQILWDNESWGQVEVMPNTLGILHLLGSPSWDGRFLRRSLKAEPKYDLISFFILRDPWDSQEVSERELSLIPFPVARLFNEELANFRVIILQNFNLLQFLLPEYQENLVKFVMNGGGLFFSWWSKSAQEL